jgi:hypothetical protein
MGVDGKKAGRMKKLVIAGTYDQAQLWIHNDLTKRSAAGETTTLSSSEYTIVHNPDQLRGMLDPHGVFVGRWRERKDIFEILNMLLVTMRNDAKRNIIQDLMVQHIIDKT